MSRAPNHARREAQRKALLGLMGTWEESDRTRLSSIRLLRKTLILHLPRAGAPASGRTYRSRLRGRSPQFDL